MWVNGCVFSEIINRYFLFCSRVNTPYTMTWPKGQTVPNNFAKNGLPTSFTIILPQISRSKHLPLAVLLPNHPPAAVSQPNHAQTAVSRPSHAPAEVPQTNYAPTAVFRPDHAPQAVSRPNQAPAAVSRPTHAPAMVSGPNHLPTAVSELNHFPGLSYSRYSKSSSNTSSKLPQINENAKSNTNGTPSQGSKNVSLSSH